VLYASTLDDMGIPRSALRPSMAPFHGVIPGIEALPLGQIDLPITFGDSRSFRTETLTFEVVGFSGMYHAILGRPAVRRPPGPPACPTVRQRDVIFGVDRWTKLRGSFGEAGRREKELESRCRRSRTRAMKYELSRHCGHCRAPCSGLPRVPSPHPRVLLELLNTAT
jgi:hypothetical protein